MPLCLEVWGGVVKCEIPLVDIKSSKAINSPPLSVYKTYQRREPWRHELAAATSDWDMKVAKVVTAGRLATELTEYRGQYDIPGNIGTMA
ncbi:unnamed protein product [Microthlaspi erraticum]|uniref:Uncharacterized protein n=1 Tax=Microthlaspi erraticum TaxID=1685480 RepID=A0A6D2HE23_9BRAS|nr:unnamed protein product [Microthlaspi erraticum]